MRMSIIGARYSGAAGTSAPLCPTHETANGLRAASPELVMASSAEPDALAPKLASAAEAAPVTGPANSPVPTAPNGEHAAPPEPTKASTPTPALANG